MTKEMITQPVNSSVMTNSIDRLDSVIVRTSSLIKFNVSHSSHALKLSGQESDREKDVFVNREELGCVSTSEYQLDILNHRKFLQVPPEINVEHIEGDMPHQKPSFLGRMKSPAVLEETYVSRSYAMFGINLNQQYHAEADALIAMSPVEADDILCACKAIVERDGESVWEGRDEEKINDSGRCKGDVGNLPHDTANATKHDISISMRSIRGNDMLPIFDNEKISHVKGQAILSEELISVDKKQLENSFNSKLIQQKAQNPRLQALAQCEAVGNCKNYCAHTEKQHCKRNNCLSIKQKYEHKRHTEDKKVNSKEVGGNFFSSILKNKVEPKILPDFEYFTAEEEEGSGGYGTVYRARRKHDGLTLAIKCPHDNANRHHIQNELKMLERFGGKNFVIKYEGSFKYGNADCLMLEHVEHDRPEVLKREIDISQLQWYGYCLFRALAGLHKMGVFHRDVKPGNFLFSRKVNKGYLIDFNLAMDLHQKYATTDKLARSYDMSFTQPLPKNLKRKANQAKERATLSTRNIIKSQGADGSGITSTKDATSTRIPSAERMREPVPSQGRKELISLAQEAMNSPNLEMTSTPASKRKRVAAPPERLDRKTVYLSPMPLQSAGIAVAGAGLIKSRWDGKHKKEGPCVGTKGFRAPEVLFKSSYQGPKIDIWSVGVTLLYLITGRSPFVGDPDQNIKDIAKLRGTEDLWEVAKLHNRESSFPTELYDMQFLPSKKLRDWCGLNTKRPDFLEVVPRCFFDLVDKCLTVNPRLRISAEEALRHEFFAPCHEQLRKQRLLRQALNSDSGTSLP